MNESYTSFAQVYDMFMDNVDYPSWSKYLIQLLKEYQVEDGLVLDLGCGTGNMTELLAKEGYDMIGVDNSEDMLEIASEKRAESGLNILYLLQDMREFELYGTESGCEHLRFHQLYSGGRRSAGSLLTRQQLSGSEGHVYF